MIRYGWSDKNVCEASAAIPLRPIGRAPDRSVLHRRDHNLKGSNTMGRLDASTTDEIYIVDDDYDMREVLSAILRNAGFRTSAFTDGRSFVRLARDQKPACVLLDLCMPGPSGLDVLKDIDAKSYPAPILMLSGRDDVLDVVTAMRNGAFDYLEKRLDAE